MSIKRPLHLLARYWNVASITITMEKINVAKPYFPREDVDDILKEIKSIFDSGMLMQGKFVKRFEELFARYVGREYGRATNSATSALQGGLNYYDVKNREVLVPVNTFLASANAVLFEEGMPVFVEINPDTLCMDMEDMKMRVTPKTKGVIFVPLSGFIPPNMKAIQKFCKDRGLFLIEDASHAQGSRHNGKMAGTFSDAAIYSFLATKVITTGGEGGIMLTDEEEIAKRVESLRFHGEDFKRGIQDRIGYSWRMTEIQAIAGITQVKRLEEIADKRMAVGRRYNEAFQKIPKLKIIPVPDGDRAVYYKYPIILDSSLKRDKVRERLEKEFSIESGTSYWPPCHLQPAYRKKFGYKEGDYPIAEDVLNRTISLPIYTAITDEEINRVIEAMQKICL